VGERVSEPRLGAAASGYGRPPACGRSDAEQHGTASARGRTNRVGPDGAVEACATLNLYAELETKNRDGGRVASHALVQQAGVRDQSDGGLPQRAGLLPSMGVCEMIM
jgi:hypothetical protein